MRATPNMTWESCGVNPVYAAMFYDYNEAKHEEMVTIQLREYSIALHDCAMKVWDLIFIFVAFKIAFSLYFKVAHWIADRCCGAIRKQHLVIVDAALRKKKKINHNNTAAGARCPTGQDVEVMEMVVAGAGSSIP